MSILSMVHLLYASIIAIANYVASIHGNPA